MKHSAETIEKIRLSKIGSKYPNRKKYFKGITLTEYTCMFCKKQFALKYKCRKPKYCSLSCSAKSRPEVWQKGFKNVDREYQKQVASQIRGEKHPRWIKDRTLLKDDHKDRGGQLHREWSISVKKRDNWKCKINNNDCNGRIEAHHILSWKDYPELRYIINNGITVCHYHHPRTKIKEKSLVNYFTKLLTKL